MVDVIFHMDKKTKDLARALFDIIISFYYIELFFSVKKELDEVKIEAKRAILR